VGAPIRLADLADREERAAVDELTSRIHAALGEVVLEADSAELWRGFLAVAAWTDAGAARDVARREGRARELARAYRALLEEDPARAEELVRTTRRFVRVLRSVGVADPFRLDEERAPRTRPLLVSFAGLLLASPLALVGALLGWLPYRLLRPAARAIARGEADLVGTVKALLGVVVMTAVYASEALAAGLRWGAPAGLAMLAVAPLSGWVALRFGERLALRREALRAVLVRSTAPRIARAVAERRRELAAIVEAELHDGAPSRERPLPGAVS
jgi:hypothetical protein